MKATPIPTTGREASAAREDLSRQLLAYLCGLNPAALRPLLELVAETWKDGGGYNDPAVAARGWLIYMDCTHNPCACR